MIVATTALRFLVLAVSTLTLAPIIAADDSLFPGASINGTHTLVSAKGTFALGFINPSGNSNFYLGIWYSSISDPKVVWVANRDRPITGSAAAMSLTLTNSGDLVITSGSTVVWSAGVGNSSNYVARLTDDGNFGVIERSSSVYVWQSFEHPTDTILPGMKVMFNRRTRQGTAIKSWRNATDPSLGDYTYAARIRGYPQIVMDYKSATLWRSGPLVGWYYDDGPISGTETVFYYERTEEQIYYYYRVKDDSMLVRLVMNQTAGVLQKWVSAAGGGWEYGKYSPETRCQHYAVCGVYGVCSAETCECVDGFVPKMPGNWSAGCVRRTALDCRPEGTTDGFVKVYGVKMPDSTRPSGAVEITGWGAAARCNETCRTKCSCTAYAPGSDGGSCIMWFEDLLDLGTPDMGKQDLFVRVAAADIVFQRSNSRHRKKFTVAGILIGVCLCVVLLVGLAAYLIKRWRRKVTNGERNFLADSDLPLLDFATVSAATNSFSQQNVVGEGGFGIVFKGRLEDGQEIAVKRLSWDSKQGFEEFMTEVMLIAKLQHKNLVRLIGCCIHETERMLIYEYMKNKSLDQFLFDKKRSTLLDWPTRYQIILGVAKGLMYLHHDSRVTIIHRDMKTGNVLLDANMEPKISDFGMARIFDRDQSQVKTKRVVGTYGYMSPEYALDGIFSVKSDIFSFGVITLEIMSGLKSKAIFHDDPSDNLLGCAWNLWNENRIMELIDPTIWPSISVPEALNCINIGLLCVQQKPEDRPLMPTVVSMLANTTDESLPQPKLPGFYYFKDPTMDDPVLRNHEVQYSTNDVSITICKGR